MSPSSAISELLKGVTDALSLSGSTSTRKVLRGARKAVFGGKRRRRRRGWL
jgi:hypothetical protein